MKDYPNKEYYCYKIPMLITKSIAYCLSHCSRHTAYMDYHPYSQENLEHFFKNFNRPINQGEPYYDIVTRYYFFKYGIRQANPKI